jgi:hypothetical protein
MSNEYYTNSATIQEGLRYDNMNFDNHVYIGQDVISSVGNAVPAGSGTRSYSDSASVTSTIDGTTFGGNVGAKGDLGSISRCAVGGSDNYVGLSYSIGSGDVESGSFNADTQARVKTHMENTRSRGSVSASPNSIYINNMGAGSSYGNAGNISFEQDISLSHIGKVAETDSGIEMIRKQGLKPVTYGWQMEIYSQSNKVANSQNEIFIAAGDCDINASIIGTSSELSTKETNIRLIPLDMNDTKDSNTANPWIDPDIQKMIDMVKRSLVEKKLFMSYEITA